MRDHFTSYLLHEINIGLIFARGFPHEVLNNSRTSNSKSRFGEEVYHCLHERMHLLAVERVEPGIHGAECDGVEREPRKVVRHRNRFFGADSRPFEHKLTCNVVHFIKLIFDGKGTERRNECSVSNLRNI